MRTANDRMKDFLQIVKSYRKAHSQRDRQVGQPNELGKFIDAELEHFEAEMRVNQPVIEIPEKK